MFLLVNRAFAYYVKVTYNLAKQSSSKTIKVNVIYYGSYSICKAWSPASAALVSTILQHTARLAVQTIESTALILWFSDRLSFKIFDLALFLESLIV